MPNPKCPARLAALTVSLALLSFLPLALTVAPQAAAVAQAPAAPVKAAPQRGTVKAIDGSNLTLTTDAGQALTVVVSAAARIQKLAPGSTDLKTAETATLADIVVGDRVLVAGAAGDTPATFNANRVILMKSSDIAQKREAEQQDWQRRGTGGIVDAVESSGNIKISSGARKLDIATTPATIYRRYADGSVKFEDAKPSTLSDLHAGDQLLARGARSADGSSVQAEEIVSGSFKNLSGTVLSIDTGKNTISLKDLVTKHNVTVQLTPNSAIHRLPAEDAATFAARAKGGAAPAAAPAASHPAGDSSSPEHAAGRPGGHSGGDLSQVVAKLPAVPLSDLHTGDAVMIVAEQSASDPGNLTAITLLAGVEPILAAAPSGSSATTLSPWSVGTGGSEAAGQQ